MPLTYARIMLRELGTTPARRARLLAGTSIADAALRDPAGETGLADVLRMFDNAHGICEPGWTLTVAARFDVAAQGALGFAMACAPTLAESFDVMARYGHVRAPWYRLDVFRQGEEWGVTMRRQFRVARHLDVAMVESVLLSAQNLVESVLGRPMREATMYFDYAAPPWRDLYRQHFSGAVKFDCRHAGLGMPQVWRQSMCLLADAGMYQAALSRLELDRRRLDSADFLTTRVSMLIAAAGDAGLDLNTTAERMNLSRRTLIRRLTEAGASFGELLEAHRKSRAAELLGNPQYTVGEVAYRLGYTEPANFTRAFKSWYGVSPTGYRRAAGDS